MRQIKNAGCFNSNKSHQYCEQLVKRLQSMIFTFVPNFNQHQKQNKMVNQLQGILSAITVLKKNTVIPTDLFPTSLISAQKTHLPIETNRWQNKPQGVLLFTRSILKYCLKNERYFPRHSLPVECSLCCKCEPALSLWRKWVGTWCKHHVVKNCLNGEVQYRKWSPTESLKFALI